MRSRIKHTQKEIQISFFRTPFISTIPATQSSPRPINNLETITICTEEKQSPKYLAKSWTETLKFGEFAHIILIL